jgi:hypothetical protein
MSSNQKTEYMLTNEHANVTLSSFVYDPDDNNLLVAAFTVATSVELLTAIKAQLEKHGKNGLRAIDLAGSETISLRGAGFGYVTVKTPLRKVNARGMATVFLHKAATDPSLVPGNCFYVVATADQKREVPRLFIQRLMSATYHTILPEWADYLLKAGLKHKLVTRLPIAGNGDFVRALRVERSPEGWQTVISAGLRDGKIAF